MNKLLLLPLFVFMGIRPMSAQTLVLHHVNGSTTDVELLTMPKVIFKNDKVHITSTVLNMEYSKEDILSFTYKGGSLKINSPKEESSFMQHNGNLIFHNIRPNAKMALYTIKGIRIPVNIIRSGETTTIPLSSIPSGVYLLNVNGRTSKITKL